MICRWAFVVCDELGCDARATQQPTRIVSRDGSERLARMVAEDYSGFSCDESGDWCPEHRPDPLVDSGVYAGEDHDGS